MKALKRTLRAIDAATAFSWSLYVLVWKSVALVMAGVFVALVVIFVSVLITGGGFGDR